MTGTYVLPKKARELLETAIAHGRAVTAQPACSSGGSPYVTIRVRWADESGVPINIEVTWHTYETGTYRLHSCSGSWYERPRGADLTLTRALRLVRGEETP